MKKKVSIIIPAFNEAENIKPIFESIQKVFELLNYEWDIVFVDDGSIDSTIDTLIELSNITSKIKFISLSRNFGKDAAIKAGLDLVKADIVITMDADLQHPPTLISEMINKWEEGYKVIYAYRNGNNPHVSFFNKFFSKIFWKLISKLSGLKLEEGISDFRLLDKNVVEVLKSLDEYGLFLRGMVKWIGFKQIGIQYVPEERLNGETTYSKKALFKLAVYGITSFSTKPLYSAIYLGFIFSSFSLLYIPYVIFSIYYDFEVAGWSSIIMTIVFFGGLQMIMLGVIGIYIGKMFNQTKNRPNYIIQADNILTK
jgi:dolichol-phosphate mannosyltransferase